MTYAGFDESEIQNEFAKLKSIVDDYKAMSSEEREKKTMSLDEFKSKLKDSKLN